MTQDQVADRTVNRTPTSDARENPKARKTNHPSRKLQLHELLRLTGAQQFAALAA
jgi:hypothetical protein